jgi:hypothetical protein
LSCKVLNYKLGKSQIGKRRIFRVITNPSYPESKNSNATISQVKQYKGLNETTKVVGGWDF